MHPGMPVAGPGQEDANREAILAYYARGLESERLARPHGLIEFERTKEVVLRHLPPPPATIADVGGGPGRYAIWLASLGYRVLHRDLVDLHVQQLHEATLGRPELSIASSVGDARDLDIADGSVDAVLLLGPLYHLPLRSERIKALREARRIVKLGGPVMVASVSRWAARLDAIVAQKLYEALPQALDELPSLERTGRMLPLFPGSFSGYCHRPRQLQAEIRAAGLKPTSVVGLEGASYFLGDLQERVDDAQSLRVLLDSARALESIPELIGMSPHMLATGIRAD